MEEQNIVVQEEKTLLDSKYKFRLLEIPKHVSEKTQQIKPSQNDNLPQKDHLSPLIMIFYSIPAFSKMSCLVILRYVYFHPQHSRNHLL